MANRQMNECFSIILPLLMGFVSEGHITSIPEQPASDRREPMMSVAFRMCREIVRISDQSLFYLSQFDLDPMHLIRQLHEASIQTISISHRSELNRAVVGDHRKNMIFILEDIHELMSLMMYTIADKNSPKFSYDTASRHKKNGNASVGGLSRHCIKIDERLILPNEIYDEEISISFEELEGGSILSPRVFNATRGFHGSKIWNSRNYIVFMLKNTVENYVSREHEIQPPRRKWANETHDRPQIDMSESLMFCFKFFWRFFKGQKTIICHPSGCEKYGPFTENLIPYGIEAKESFFDFSWSNMHRKPVRIAESLAEIKMSSGYRDAFDYSTVFFVNVLNHFRNSVNCTLVFLNRELPEEDFDILFDEIEADLKFDVDLHRSAILVSAYGIDYSKLDFSVSFDFGAVCIAVPHSGFVSQGLVIFKSFSPWVWIITLITAILYILSQFIFQYSQCGAFHRLYSEAEIDHYRGTSSILTIYAYFICGSPPCLLLGRLFTGKILFLIFSFSALIISTVFVSGMTTLLSERVLKTEISSLKMLEESDLFIQTAKVFSYTHDLQISFDEQNISAALKAKFRDDLLFYTDEVIGQVYWFKYLSPNSSKFIDVNKPLGTESIDRSVIEKVQDNIRSIATTDAFLVHLPISAAPKESLFMRHIFMEEDSEYHLIDECLMKDPLMITFTKHSFYFDKLNLMIARLLESGLARRYLEEIPSDMRFAAPSAAPGGKEPRSYNLNDLQSAFISLIVGLFLSYLAFVGELFIDYFQDTTVVKRFKSAFF